MFTTRKRSFALSLGAAAAAGAGMLMMGVGDAASAPESQAKVGQKAPDFTVTDYMGKEHTLSDYTEQGKAVVLEWFNPDCPFVKKHYRDDTMTMNSMRQEMAEEDVVWLLVNSGREGHPTTGTQRMADVANEWDINSPILLDFSGEVGKAYGAKRTPEMYVIDSSGVLVYHGAIDDRADAQAPGKKNYVRNALSQTLAGETVTMPETKAYGCSVKY